VRYPAIVPGRGALAFACGGIEPAVPMSVPPSDSTTGRRGGDTRTAISDGMVALLKDYYGVGPSQAKTYYHDDLVVCLMRGGSRASSRRCWEGGRTAAVIQQRMEFQEVMRERFVAVIEEATGRRVVGFMSGNQQDPDMICEVFVLAPTELVDSTELPGS